MKIPSIHLLLLLSAFAIPGAQGQFWGTLSQIFGGITGGGEGSSNPFISAIVSVTQAVQAAVQAVQTVATTAAAVVGRTVGIATEDNTGPFCNSILQGVVATLQGTFGDSLGLEDFGCGCQLLAGLDPKVKVSCKPPNDICFDDGPDKYCGKVQLDTDIEVLNIQLIPPAFDLAKFTVKACWDFQGDFDYKTVCINGNTNQDMETISDCQITAGGLPCQCQSCDGGAGVIADCSAINLNNDISAGAEEIILPVTPCVGLNNLDAMLIIEGKADPNFNLFMLPLDPLDR